MRNGGASQKHHTCSQIPVYSFFSTFAVVHGHKKKKKEKKGREKHVKLFICKTERRKTSAGMIHSSHGVLIGQKSAATAAVEDYFARGVCKEKVCTDAHKSDNDTKTRDPVRSLNNTSKVKLMLGEVYSSGLSGGHAIQMASPAGRAEEEAECRDGGACNSPQSPPLPYNRWCKFVWLCLYVCVQGLWENASGGSSYWGQKKKKKARR